MEKTEEQSPGNGKKRESLDSFHKYLKTGEVEDLSPFPFQTVVQDAKDHDFSTKGHTADWSSRLAPITQDASLSTLQGLHHNLMEAWKSSAAYDACCTLFQDVILKQEGLKITSCMCIALGSISQKFGGGIERDRRSMSQLVVFETWLELLGAYRYLLVIFNADSSSRAKS